MIKHLEHGLTALALTAVPLLVTALPVQATAVPQYFQISTHLNGKCLASNGDNVEVQTCNAGTGNQLWYWSGRKLVNSAEQHCLDVKNGEVNAAAQVVGDCHGLANQRWYKDGNWLRTEVNNQCLSIQNSGDPSEHAGINLRNCGPYAWQYWNLPSA
ncbi:RICIN domain-containing protein [Streptomyces sp. GbtcB6]|uniref:RICIN domain-containing protein n=1 Tax=Streptomyces sp. GbtcB6 TaxID=2824751 RepID=UPI001C308DB9|nr:RICIN domain-containing protein [Streptomyces sp. GbtcB6]